MAFSHNDSKIRNTQFTRPGGSRSVEFMERFPKAMNISDEAVRRPCFMLREGADGGRGAQGQKRYKNHEW